MGRRYCLESNLEEQFLNLGANYPDKSPGFTFNQFYDTFYMYILYVVSEDETM